MRTWRHLFDTGDFVVLQRDDPAAQDLADLLQVVARGTLPLHAYLTRAALNMLKHWRRVCAQVVSIIRSVVSKVPVAAALLQAGWPPARAARFRALARARALTRSRAPCARRWHYR